MLPSLDVSRGYLLRTGSEAFDSRFSVNFFAQAKKGDQLISESMSCVPLSRSKAAMMSKTLEHSSALLMEKIVDPDNLVRAWNNVRSNRGALGRKWRGLNP